MIHALGLILPTLEEPIRLSGGGSPAHWRCAMSRGAAQAILDRWCTWAVELAGVNPELTSSPLFGTELDRLAGESGGVIPPVIAEDPSPKPIRPESSLLPQRNAAPEENVSLFNIHRGRKRSRLDSTTSGLSGSPAEDSVPIPTGLPAQATRDLLDRHAESHLPLTKRNSRSAGKPKTPSEARSSPRVHESVVRWKTRAGIEFHALESGPSSEERQVAAKHRHYVRSEPPGDQGLLAQKDWSGRVARGAAKCFNSALSNYARSNSPTRLNAAALARELSCRIEGPLASRELLSTATEVFRTVETSRDIWREGTEGQDRRPSAAKTTHVDSRRGPSARGVARPENSSRRSVTATGGTPLTKERERTSAPEIVPGPIPTETSSGAGETAPANPIAERWLPSDNPGPPPALKIAPPVLMEMLPALLPMKSLGKPAPPIASRLAIRGAQAEAAVSDDDLSALADKIKRILDGQARRHGISV